MAMTIPGELARIVEELRKVDERAVKDGVSRHFLETEMSGDGSELRINGNPEGLIYFARSVLEVVQAGLEGGHQHFDANGILDRCDRPVVVRLKAADWDS